MKSRLLNFDLHAVLNEHIHWGVFFWFVPFSIPAVLLGTWLIKYVNPMYLQFFVALFLIANVPEPFRTRKQQEKEETPHPKFVLAFVGFFAGFISGVTGAIGLIFNRFYLRYGLSKEEILATRAANEILLHAIKLVIYLLLGLYSKNALWLGMTIAVVSVVSAYTVKFILPYLSEHLFRKIGYGAMVVSGIFLLVNTTQTIVRQDKISFAKNKYDEIAMNWRKSNLILEFTFDDGLEIERPIEQDELPRKLKSKYQEMEGQYGQILLEKVFRFGSEPSYGFYCCQGDALTKLEYLE